MVEKEKEKEKNNKNKNKKEEDDIFEMIGQKDNRWIDIPGGPSSRGENLLVD